jgi:hypothetical protein
VRVCTYRKSLSLNLVLFNHGHEHSYLDWYAPPQNQEENQEELVVVYICSCAMLSAKLEGVAFNLLNYLHMHINVATCLLVQPVVNPNYIPHAVKKDFF